MPIRRFVMQAGLAVCFAAGTAAAQHPRAPVGIQIGYSRAELRAANRSRLEGREGALAGVYLTGELKSGLALQSELLFALKGGRAVASLLGGGEAPLDIELAYIETPMLVRWSPFPRRGRVHPVVFGGGAPSIRIGCDVQLDLEAGPLRTACENVDVLPSFKRLDFGLVAGGGVHRDWAETTLALEVRYTIGLPSILGSTADVRNRQFGLMLALSF